VHTGFWWGRPKVERQPGRFDTDGRIIVKLILKKWDGEAWTGLFWCGTGTGVRCL